MTKYNHNDNSKEEHIDLVPILKNLYFDQMSFMPNQENENSINNINTANCLFNATVRDKMNI